MNALSNLAKRAAVRLLRSPLVDAQLTVLRTAVKAVDADDFLAEHGTNRILFQLIPRHTAYPREDLTEIVRDGVRLRVCRADYMQWHAYARVKDHTLRALTSLLRGMPDVLFLDVGANIGALSLKLAARTRVETIAFEPNPEIFGRLEDNLALNPALAPRIRAMNLALGEAEGTTTLVFDPEHSGKATIAGRQSGARSVEVPVSTLDRVVSTHAASDRPLFIKIDVEGHEMAVLRGARETLETRRPTLCLEVMDNHLKTAGTSGREIVAFLRDHGYSLTRADDGSPLPAVIPAGYFDGLPPDVIARPRERVGA